MDPMQHQMMGYDRAITMFSPDGRLLQVEYAKKTVKQGSIAIGMRTKEGVLIVADKRIVDQFIVPESIEKITEVDNHIILCPSGILSDARVLAERAQLRAQQHRVTYDTGIDVLSVVKDIANLKQYTTQSGGLRPFGVSLIIAGVDETGPRLFVTDPTGIYFEYYVVAIGEKDNEISKFLSEKYKRDMPNKDAIRLGIEAIFKVLDEDINEKRIDCSYVVDGKITKMKEDEIKKIISSLKGAK